MYYHIFTGHEIIANNVDRDGDIIMEQGKHNIYIVTIWINKVYFAVTKKNVIL